MPDPSAPPSGPSVPPDVRTVREVEAAPRGRSEDGAPPPPVVEHPEWRERFRWLVQGTTREGAEDEPFDMALFGDGAAHAVHARWRRLLDALDVPRAIHGRQVHGSAVRFHREGPPGLHLSPATDGHATAAPGTLLTISVADCVPVTLVDPVRRAVAMVHAGWRGAAAGILEQALALMAERLGSEASDLHVHFGPAICGRCYEVGPEVHAALGLGPPDGPQPVDLRAVLAARAVGRGVPADHVTHSAHCTRCGDGRFFSHRGGRAERQIGFVAIRPPPG